MVQALASSSAFPFWLQAAAGCWSLYKSTGWDPVRKTALKASSGWFRMKTPIFLVVLLAPVALYAAPGVTTVVGDESSGIFTKQIGTTAPIPASYTGLSYGGGDSFVPVAYNSIIPGVVDSFVPVAYNSISPGVVDSFVPVDYTGISPGVVDSFVQVVDTRGNVVDPNAIVVPTPTLYHQSGSTRHNQIGGGYYPGGGYQQGGYYPGGGYQQGGYYPGGGYHQGGYYPGGGYPGQGVGGVIGNVVGGLVGGLVHGSSGYPGRYPGGYPGGYPGRYPGRYPGSGDTLAPGRYPSTG